MKKKLAFLAVLACAAAIPAQALAADVTISTTGYAPSPVTIAPGDSVTWMNTDTANHQVTSSKGAFTSPVMKTNESYSFTFRSAGTFAYTDVLFGKKSKLGGSIIVKALPAPTLAVTLAASGLQVVYGGGVTLSGTVSSGQSGEKVTLLARKSGEASFMAIATFDTLAGGAWSSLVKPTIGTSYQARVKGATSSTATVGVRPLVSFRFITLGRISTRVVAARSFAGHYVQLQRRSSLGQWLTLKRVRLGSTGGAVFRAALPTGTSSLRIAMSINQAGAGYLAGISRTIVRSRG